MALNEKAPSFSSSTTRTYNHLLIQTPFSYSLRRIISILLTSLFVVPLWRHKFHSTQLKRTARRSVIAATVTLTTSCVNISLLAGRGGIEEGLMFVTTWECDVRLPSI